VKVLPVRYDYFDIFRFLLPGWLRRGPITRLEQQIRTARQSYPHSPISVIAHSYGTYAIVKLLAQHADIDLHWLILCGSIVPTSYRWEHVAHRIAKRPVINECGSSDIWPVFAKACSWGYGPSGTFGFGHVLVQDSFHAIAHSGFFSEEFYKQRWQPLFANPDALAPDGPAERPRSPWYFSIVALLPIQWIVTIVMLLALIYGALFVFS
jgi:pimeloyl-ACP methyl ester carboxylesterase